MITATQAIVQSSYSKIVKTGLVAWFDAMNDNSYPETGTTWTNLAAVPAISGTLTNGPTFDSRNGGSINFDGIDDRVVVPNDTNLQIGTEDYALDAWVNYTVLPGTQGAQAFMFRKNVAGTTEYDLLISSASGDYAYRLASVQGNGTTTTTYTSSTAVGITTNTWYYFCVTRQGTNISFYMTGSLISSTSVGLATVYSSSLASASGSIGSAANGNNRTTGRIAIVRIYKNKALSATEVLQNYNADKARFGY